MRVTQPNAQKTSKKSGDYSEEVTPVPISNTVVKLLCADDTWWEAAWESRTLPVFFLRLHGQAVKTPPFHGGNSGSIPDGVTKTEKLTNKVGFSFIEYLSSLCAEVAQG